MIRTIITMLFAFAAAFSAARAEDYILGDFCISGKTGAIAAGGDGLLKNCRDVYSLETREGSRNSNENADQVVKAEKGDNRITLDCRNEELGLAIRKTYELAPSGRILFKTVEFSGGNGFILYTTGVRMDRKARNGGYYHKPVWHSADPSRIAARSVSRPIPLLGFISLVCFVPREHDTLAVYRSAVNGEAVFPFGGVGGARGGLTLTRDGWQQQNALDAVTPDNHPAVTVAYELFDGDEFAFYSDFVNRDAIADFRGPDAAGWPEKLVAEGGWDTSYLSNRERLMELSRRLPWGTNYAWTLWGWFAPYYGDYAYRAADAAPGTADPAQIRALFEELRGELPQENIKFGCYILPGAINRSSKVGQEHPEWFNYRLDGSAVGGCYADYAPDDPTFAYSIRRGALEHWRDRIPGILRELKADYLYIDGGVAGAVIPDWKTMSCDQDSDWYELWQTFQDACQEAGGLNWSNQSVSVFNDGGYHEFNWYPTYANDWRTFTDRVLTAVIFRGAGRHLGLVGYIWNGQPGDPATRLQINSYFVLQTFPSFLDVKGDAHFRAISFELPYILAAYQLSGSEVVADANPAPDWRDTDQEIEVHAFRFPGGGRLGVLGHGMEPQTGSFEVDTAPLGLKSNLPLYVWKHQLADPEEAASMLSGPAGLRRVFTTELLEVLPSGTPARYQRKWSVPPELAQVVILTNSPALLTALDGQELPLPLPAMPGVKTAGTVVENRVNLEIDSDEFSGELVILLPDDFPAECAVTIQPRDAAANSVAAGPRPQKFTEELYCGRRAVKTAFPAGRSTIVVSSKQKQ